MKSLTEALNTLPELITESYIYSLDMRREFGDRDLQADIKSINKEQYINILKQLLGDKYTSDKNDVASIVDAAVNAWIDQFGKDPMKIPFCFDEKGNCKIRRDVADAIGFKEYQHKGGIVYGNGSLKFGKYISTRDQELATVILWNKIVQRTVDPDEFMKDDKKLQEFIAIQSGTEDKPIDLDDSWVQSCKKQIQAIRKYLESKKLDYREYSATRYDDKGRLSGPDGQVYAKFVTNYITACNKSEKYNVGVSKDTYDPSDIILIRRGHGNLENLVSTSKGKSYSEMHDIYKEMFINGEIIGVSLKKISGDPTYEEFNVGSGTTICNVKDCEVKHSHKRGVESEITGTYFKCTGKFVFSETTDPNTKDATDSINETVVDVALRSFSGGKDLDIDIKKDGGPSLGKVPRDGWRNCLGTTNQYSEENIKFITEKMSNPKIMEKIINIGIKNGPWCLPFVLIH